MTSHHYIAIIVYRSSSEDERYQPLYEECITLIQARSLSEARLKAEHIAAQRECTFNNASGILISWKLHRIIDVRPMLEDAIGEVTELCSRHFYDIDGYLALEKSF